MLAAGSKLGPYDIQSAIGAGGMGEVYRARDARLNRDVAIKVLPATYSSDADRLHRFAQEARAAAALSHPNILAIYDIGEGDGAPYIVSELLEGETLRERLRSGALSMRKAIDYAQQIARGLAAAHEKGIVHRDLKPENIFLTNDGHAKILDFGLAKLTRPELGDDATGNAPTQQVGTDAGTVMGTVGYMSPEQVRGKPADSRSDIFALGAILYEMLSGKRAFHGDSAAETMSAILKEDPPELTETNRNVSPALERIVRHCLEKNPAERFQSARDVAFNLEALSGISTSSRSAVKAIPEDNYFRRWLLPLIGTLFLVASWAGVYWLGRRHSQVSTPTFHQVTFRRGTVWAARFVPDGQNIVYGAAWDGQPQEIFASRYDSSDSRSTGLTNAQVLAVSSTGELAIALHPVDVAAFVQSGTLARVPLDGGAPREVLENAQWADWTPDGQRLAVIRATPNGNNHLELPIGNPIYEPRAWVSHVRVSPRGDFVAIADHVGGGDDGRIVIIDTHGNSKASSSFYSSVEGLAWTPEGKEVWFSAVPAGSARAIYAMDLSGKERIIYRAPAGLTVHDISRAGRVLVSEDNTRIGITALPPGETRERSLSWFDWSLLTDLSADGKTIIFSESGAAVGTNYSVLMRKTDGSPAVRLGNGSFSVLSPDGKWVISATGAPAKLILLPTGPGEPRTLVDDPADHFGPAWLPNSKSIIFSALPPGHGARTYLLDLDGGQPRALTPERTRGGLLTPDGRFLLTFDDSRQRSLYPLAGGEPKKINVAIAPNERIFSFFENDHTVLVGTTTVPMRVSKLDLDTGKREPFKEIEPGDLAGLKSIPNLRFSADGKSYAYSTFRILSDLYVVSGLQ